MIFTDDSGRPIDRPMRESFASDVDYVVAVHAYKQAITNAANRAFDQAFCATLRNGRGKP
jgi:hypothetical protein